MTSAPARRTGSLGRGLLRPCLAADLVVFDPVNLQDAASYEQPRSYPQGIPYVVVNGELVVDDAETAGLTPGRALGRGQRS